jgi:hypothetical protein
MNTFQLTGGGLIAAAIAVVVAILLVTLLWLRERRRASAAAVRAEAAESLSGHLAAEGERLAAAAGERGGRLTALEQEKAALEKEIAFLRDNINRSERNPSALAADFLRDRAGKIRTLLETLEAGLAAHRNAFVTAVDAATADTGGHRSRRNADDGLESRRQKIAAGEQLKKRLWDKAEQTAGLADDFGRDAFDVGPWQREVDLAVWSADRPTLGSYHAPGWPDLVSTLRRDYPPEEPADVARQDQP